MGLHVLRTSQKGGLRGLAVHRDFLLLREMISLKGAILVRQDPGLITGVLRPFI